MTAGADAEREDENEWDDEDDEDDEREVKECEELERDGEKPPLRPPPRPPENAAAACRGKIGERQRARPTICPQTQ